MTSAWNTILSNISYYNQNDKKIFNWLSKPSQESTCMEYVLEYYELFFLAVKQRPEKQNIDLDLVGLKWTCA